MSLANGIVMPLLPAAKLQSMRLVSLHCALGLPTLWSCPNTPPQLRNGSLLRVKPFAGGIYTGERRS